ncbi:MAG: aminopeptidase N [Nannocystaceae bacterium]|nr:aminopeptidase N [bacterium]
MKDPAPQPIHRKDYQPPAFLIDTVELHFDLLESHTSVRSTLGVRRNGEHARPLVLDGERLEIRSVEVDGSRHEDYTVDEEHLTLREVPDAFTLTTEVHIKPHSNTELSGLYKSSGNYCTQCEAEGFRRITYFLDRPDVMAKYRTTVVADKAKYPVLLSNGNAVERADLDGGRHSVTWEDPFPKPSYLFALVAADLACKRGTFTTRSGREVALEIWVEHPNIDACDHALASLQKSMKWDEEVYGLEYDLDIYMIVAVSDFNMGAMENKGLNVFNAKYVLARPDTATDDDYEDVEGVIAHEYFHNWTGNRVTCRDWFQLTLKEGLTVFRDEQFTADMTSPAVKRIRDVRVLRTAQFAQDASPTAHPIRPDSYIEMNNFYTVTVYNKGAEVIRMMHTLLGPDAFRKGMDLYFERHDGQAVTCDDFRAAMADAGGVDLDQFGLWYSQSGTPRLRVYGEHDPVAQTYSLTLEQLPPAAGGPAVYAPMHMPIATGLLGSDGSDLPLRPSDPSVSVRGTTAILELRAQKQTFTFEGVPQTPLPSVLRGFSAPVKLEQMRSPEDLALSMARDADPFNRWDAGQTFASDLLLSLAQAHASGSALEVDPKFVQAFGAVLDDGEQDPALAAFSLTLPDERVVGQRQDVVDVDGLHAARTALRGALASAHAPRLWAIYRDLREKTTPYVNNRQANGWRRLKNVALGYLIATGEDAAIDAARSQFHDADNMTDAQSALSLLVDQDHPARDEALVAFYDRWKTQPLVIDKWFAVQAISERPDTLDRVRALCDHPDMKLTNPNRVRSLLGTFSVRNQVRFHAADGRGYTLLADTIVELDSLNPQVAARLTGAFMSWRRFDEGRRAMMQDALRRIRETEGLSRDVFELTSKALG